jgi:DNA-binding Lrp family transcriptional regulator
MLHLDSLNRRILRVMDTDARLPVVKIAGKLGVSRALVSSRIKKMEENGVILGYFTIFDTGIVGYNTYRVLLRLLNISNIEKSEFISHLNKHSNVFWLGEVGGRWDIAVNFICKGNSAFNETVEEISVKFGAFVKEIEILTYVDIYDYARSYLDPSDTVREEFFHRLIEDRSVVLDKLDKDIIQNISTNARIDNTQLGKVLGVSRNTVKKRIDKLIKEKVILGFRTFTNLQNIGYQSNMLFLQINKMDRERETELGLFLRMLPQVTFVVKHIEKWKVGMEVETKTAREFQDILLDIRSKFSDIISDYDTFPLLKDHVVNYFPRGVLEE